MTIFNLGDALLHAWYFQWLSMAYFNSLQVTPNLKDRINFIVKGKSLLKSGASLEATSTAEREWLYVAPRSHSPTHYRDVILLVYLDTYP